MIPTPESDDVEVLRAALAAEREARVAAEARATGAEARAAGAEAMIAHLKLVIAKLDRLSRNLAFIAALMDSSVEFVAVDNPHATRLTLHILAAVAEHEREMIAQRTKAALQAAKARGIRLGSNGADRLAPAYRAEAIERARLLAPVLAGAKAFTLGNHDHAPRCCRP